MKKSKKIVLSTTLALSILGSGFSGIASAKDKNFEAWLEQYGAWDILADSYSKMEASPELIMKQAQTSYILGRYSAAIKTLQSTPAFTDNATEVKRLWLGGKALRASGRPEQSFIWFSQAAKLMNTETLKNSFKNEPRFKSYWFDVWRNMYWSYLVTPAPTSEARRMILNQTLQQAAQVWPTTYFVLKAKSSWNEGLVNSTIPVFTKTEFNPIAANSTASINVDQEAVNGTANGTTSVLAQKTPVSMQDNATITVTDSDRILLSKSLAAASLGSMKESNNILEGLSNPLVKEFWQDVTAIAESGITPDNIQLFKEKGLLHPWSFFASGTLTSSSSSIWKLPEPSSPSWAVFQKKLLRMPPVDALATIDRETGSLLLSGDIVTALQNYKLAFSFLSGNMSQAKETWEKIDITALPLSLRLAGCLAFKEPFDKILSPSEGGRKELFFIASGLCSAGGLEYFPSINSPFWERITSKKFNSEVNNHPLDRLMLFAELDESAAQKISDETARRSAYLFPYSELGARSFIALASEASAKRDFKLAGFYLKNIDPVAITPELRLKWLIARAEYELLIGDEAKALNTYKEIQNAGGKLEPEKELKLALLIQQKGDKHKAQVILERIWQDHEKLDNELQAEILFWIAEGEYSMGRKEESLRHYLELAYKYPEQNIWAVTAMYRSSMIYEMKGQYSTAKRLLKTVIKLADRKSQKEAAKARIDAIDGKLAKIGADKGPVFPY